MKLLHELLNLTRPLVGVDLETTGVNPKTSGICELALEIYAPGVAPTEFRTLVNPLLDIPDGATGVHGITNAMVQGAPTFVQLAADLSVSLTGCDFVGYNPRFDLRQLLEEFQRAGYEWSYEGARILCGLRLWQCIESRTLTDAVRRWLSDEESPRTDADVVNDESTGQAHNALWDIRKSTRVVAAQLGTGRLPLDLDELHELQWPGWFDSQGKLRWNEQGVLCMGGFGAHPNKPLHEIPRSYLLGFLANPDKGFDPKVRAAAKQAASGTPITKP